MKINISQKNRASIALFFIFINYLLESSSLLFYVKLPLFQFYWKPLVHLIVIFVILTFPRPRPKSKLKMKENINYWAFNFAAIYIIVYSLAGLIDGFGKSPYSHTPLGILNNLFYIFSILVARELVRSYVVNTFVKKENFLFFILISLFMTIISISFSKFENLKNVKDCVMFFAKDFAPDLSKSLISTYFVFIGGAGPSIIYQGLIETFEWLSPILPNLKWITMALVGVMVPIFSLSALQGYYLKEMKSLKHQEEEDLLGWIITSVASILLIWFTVGVFPIFPSVIATGSMEPMIKPGDVILIKRVNIDDLKVGDVIQFKRENILISHRIIEIVKKDNIICYRTKGDNNSVADSELVKPQDIKGKIIKVVPKIGWPTLLLKSRNKVPLEKVQF
ncbi:signal peptidase I [Caloramator sp. CAR-1]|uniref:signal peptidase I n=1 Tax=Caloramator sp. CAR-1 TaxID=3062777 RepID=UPI0026E2247F|nr:signal peptidase I [Caloramator sp. CAR-1]MDO6354988.1 signal peptidase I [Caloramator sp. CAR-1]